ncbi:Chromosome partition protein Smc [Aquamicrobium terrae]
MSAFLANFVRREKPMESEVRTDMPSTDNLADTLARLREDALQVHHDYRGSTQDIESRISRLSATISTLYPVLKTVHRSYVEASSRVGLLERESESLKKDLEGATEDLADHRSRLAERTKEAEELVVERERLRGEVDRYEKEIVELRRVREGLEFELKAGVRRTEELDRRLVELEEEKGRRDNAYFEAKHTIARLTNDLGETRLALEARNSAYGTLRQSMDAEQASRARMTADLTKSRNEVQHVRSQLGHLEHEHAASRKRYESQIERGALAAAEIERDRDAIRSRLTVTDKINRSQRRKMERAHEHIGYLQTVLRRLIDEKQVDDVPEVDLDYDFDQDEAQLPDEVKVAAAVSALPGLPIESDDKSRPEEATATMDCEDEEFANQGVVKLRAAGR